MADEKIGPRLAEDQWLIFNTIPFVFKHLETPDISRCSLVCKLWYNITLDPIYWKTVRFSNFTTYLTSGNMCRFLDILEERKTVHLKLQRIDCERSNPYLDNETLKTLEISQCSSRLCETFLTVARNLESIKIELIPGSDLNLIKIDFISKMIYLRELRVSFSGKVDYFDLIFTDLRDLRVLHLLNMDVLYTTYENFKYTNKLEVLALGNVHSMPDSGVFSILRASPALKKLRLECCSNWDAVTFFEAIGQMENLTCLELLDFKIVAGFEHGVELCPNVEELTIMPSCDRFYMGVFNARIFMAAQNMGKTLKKFTLGFSKKYLNFVNDRTDQKNVIPRCADGDIRKDPLFEFSSLVPLGQVEAELSSLMPGVQVEVTELDDLGNIF